MLSRWRQGFQGVWGFIQGSNFAEPHCVHRVTERYWRKKNKMHTRIPKATTECRLVPHRDKCHKQSQLLYMVSTFKGLQRCHVTSHNSLAFSQHTTAWFLCIFITAEYLPVLYYNHSDCLLHLPHCCKSSVADAIGNASLWPNRGSERGITRKCDQLSTCSIFIISAP